MPSTTDHERNFQAKHRQKFQDLEHYMQNPGEITRRAKGGNSIIFTYPPCEEYLYLRAARERLEDQNVRFIDISQLFVDFIDEIGWEEFKEYYELMQPSPHKVFFDDTSTDYDLFDMIIDAIRDTTENDEVPMIIRTGILNGTHIENTIIMEHEAVMRASQPIVVFYPGTFDEETLWFLNHRKASDYRGTVIY